VQALFALFGVFFLLAATVFHYFSDKIDRHAIDSVRLLFIKPETEILLGKIKDNALPPEIVRDFNQKILDIAEPRRMLRRLLLLLPLTGCLFLVTASLGSLGEAANLMTLEPMLNLSVGLAFLLGIILAVYSGIELCRLTRKMA